MCQLLIRKSEFDHGEGKRLRDPVFLFACHLEWRDKGNFKAYQELVAALDDANEDIRVLAEHLLHRASTRPRPHESPNPSWGES